ncbi:hypothetical protein DFP72DRAFT_1080256 [Ephemerocybe angulata]|uniref:Uncharacterized protein n=1 Tax=Ephemerocybe angulata TaxID=980116 RepID=A0A8H6HCG1_9AGAR|nr:hypothetical protein DFP72DRAFT_1080256 [Tulosesus angulatus]
MSLHQPQGAEDPVSDNISVDDHGPSGKADIEKTPRIRPVENNAASLDGSKDSESRIPVWVSDPQEYYKNLYDQFTNIILIASGVQAAIIAVLNDILSNDPLKPTPFSDGDESQSHSHRMADLGMALGIYAVALNLAVAAISAVNVGLVSQFSIAHAVQPKHPEVFQIRVTRCMQIQMRAFLMAAVSLVTLCSLVNTPLTVSVGFAILIGIGSSLLDIVEVTEMNVWGPQHMVQYLEVAYPVCVVVLEVYSRSPVLPATFAGQGLTVFEATNPGHMDLAKIGITLVGLGAFIYPCATNGVYLSSRDNVALEARRPTSLVIAATVLLANQIITYVLKVWLLVVYYRRRGPLKRETNWKVTWNFVIVPAMA